MIMHAKDLVSYDIIKKHILLQHAIISLKNSSIQIEHLITRVKRCYNFLL